MIKELVCKIINAKKSYYAGSPIMSDYEYDMIEKELQEVDPEHPVTFLVGYSPEYDWWLKHYEEVK